MDTQNSIVITHVPSRNDLVVEIVFEGFLVRQAARLRKEWVKVQRGRFVEWADFGWVEVE